MPKVIFGCCFCGRDIKKGGKGVALVNQESGGFEQQWWCHLDCFLAHLTPTARGAYEKVEED
jgi:hypothetical protein